jgi:hypothetical protein
LEAGVWAQSAGIGKYAGLDAERYEKTLFLVEEIPDPFFFPTSAPASGPSPPGWKPAA